MAWLYTHTILTYFSKSKVTSWQLSACNHNYVALNYRLQIYGFYRIHLVCRNASTRAALSIVYYFPNKRNCKYVIYYLYGSCMVFAHCAIPHYNHSLSLFVNTVACVYFTYLLTYLFRWRYGDLLPMCFCCCRRCFYVCVLAIIALD